METNETRKGKYSKIIFKRKKLQGKEREIKNYFFVYETMLDYKGSIFILCQKDVKLSCA
jgi:hypothetical protein